MAMEIYTILLLKSDRSLLQLRSLPECVVSLYDVRSSTPDSAESSWTNYPWQKRCDIATWQDSCMVAIFFLICPFLVYLIISTQPAAWQTIGNDAYAVALHHPEGKGCKLTAYRRFPWVPIILLEASVPIASRSTQTSLYLVCSWVSHVLVAMWIHGTR